MIRTAGARFRSQVFTLAAWAVVLAVLPLLGLSNQFIQLLTLAFLLAIPAVGLSLLYGEGGDMSVACGALYGVGAYVAAIGAQEGVLTLWAAMPLGAIGAAIAATLIGLVALRIRGHYFLIVTFAFAELWRISTVNLKGITGGNQGILVLQPIELPGLGNVDSLAFNFYLALAMTVAAALLVVLLRFAPFGRALRTVRENERLAASLGLNVARQRLLAFAISGALAGWAGVHYAYNLKHIGPDLFGAHVGIQIVLILLIGGARSVVGPLIGSIVFFMTPEVIHVDPVSTQILYGAVLIAIVLVSPEGLAPGAAGWALRSLNRLRGVGRPSAGNLREGAKRRQEPGT